MNTFTEVYNKASEVLKNQLFLKEWDDFLKTTLAAPSFFTAKGFDNAKKDLPDKIRRKISTDAGVGVGTSKTQGTVIYNASVNSDSSGVLAERAATLKMLKHLHLVLQKGGQQVWVYSPPKMDTKWVFDEITGSDATVKARLDREEEIFSNEEKLWMSDALQLSLKIAEDTKVKLAGAATSDATKAVVRKWFLDEDSTDTDLNNAITTLSAGFNKIAIACNNNTLVFTDYADWRSKRNRFFGGAIPGGEGGGFPVIYLEGAFTRLTGNSGKKWLCAETIIHEMSHHELSTEDHKYDSDGLKPSKAALPYAKAIANADSWGYFAIDLAGYLSAADALNVLK